MRKSKQQRNHVRADTQSTPALPPRPSILSAVSQLVSDSPTEVEVDFNHRGEVRSLSAFGGQGLSPLPFTGSTRAYAASFVQSSEAIKALRLQFATLVDGATDEFDQFTRVEFDQVANIRGVDQPIRVRGGSVQVFVDNLGAIMQVNNTVRHGRKPQRLGKIITPEAAATTARTALGVETASVLKSELVLSSHEGNMDPCYEIMLSSITPRRLHFYLVHARTGQVVYDENRLRSSQLPQRKRPKPHAPVSVAGRVLLRIPDYTKPIDGQAHDTLIDGLPDPKVLKNERLIMKIRKGSSWVLVRANEAGDFKYAPESDAGQAAIVFFALNEQLKLMESWGLKKQTRPITVYVNDPDPETADNAYFAADTYSIHIGQGSGIKNGGLAKFIAFDIGVEWHEDGHHIVFLMAPGQDLPGRQGAAIHESTGDTLGDLLMDFWFRNKYQDILGPFTKDDIKKDPRIIGVYALYPEGIRIQLNDKKTPQDETGEPHDDGLISGGATADLLVEMATADDVTIAQGLEQFGRLYLMALTLVPVHNVSFKDLLRAFITSDQKLNNGAFRTMIETSFNRHGITLNSVKKPKSKSKQRPQKKSGSHHKAA